MGLTLVSGPANAGKVALLLERYVRALDRDAFLIVPTRSDVERVERQLLEREGALLGGEIGTFDDLFARLATGDRERRAVLSDAQRALAVRRAISSASLNGLGRSARFAGFADALAAAVADLEAALVDPGRLDGDLGRLYGLYRLELDRLGVWDRDLLRWHAADRLERDLAAWGAEPVFAYGFEDLTGAEWKLLQALSGRTEVTVSLPYEPGRTVFASLTPTATDLAGLAAGRLEELPPAYDRVAPPALAYLERALFEDAAPDGAPPIEGAIRFFEAAGTRGALELVAEEVLALVRSGTAPERIGVVCPAPERIAAALETAFGTLGVPYALEARLPLAQTPFGQALLALLRFAWLRGGRADLFAYLRSPYSGLGRGAVDFVEGRLRGRAVTLPERVEEEMQALRGAPLPALERLREPGSPLDAVRELAAAMLRAAYGVEAPPVGEQPKQDLRAHETVAEVLRELERWERIAETLSREEVVASLERASIRGAAPGEPGRVAVVDLLRARTRLFDAVFVIGLEEGTFPRRGHPSPFLDDDRRAALGARLTRPDPVGRDRYLFYTACTRPSRRLYLVREAATDDGAPLEPSPFWEEVRALFPDDDTGRWTRRRALSALTWPLESAPSERERLRALATLWSEEDQREAAAALARANGWERRLDRARRAFSRRTRLRHPLVLQHLRARSTFNVTELERFADCSSAWFVDRLLEPKAIDAEVDPKLRGSIAHSALFKFFSALPRELGTDGLDEARVEDAVRLMRRCLEQAVGGVRMEMSQMQRRELEEGLWRDLEALVRDEAAAEGALTPRRFEVSFGSERSAPELQRGLELGNGLALSGKIDRIDVDPFSARGIVQDYKAGRRAPSAREIERELRLQIPLYMLVLRDLVGIEPLGGVYRPLAGDRRPRGLLRADARDDVLAGFARNDYLGEEAFWAQIDGAKGTATELAERIRAGDVRHDPRGGECPQWCDLWPMCRVARA